MRHLQLEEDTAQQNSHILLASLQIQLFLLDFSSLLIYPKETEGILGPKEMIASNTDDLIQLSEGLEMPDQCLVSCWKVPVPEDSRVDKTWIQTVFVLLVSVCHTD